MVEFWLSYEVLTVNNCCYLHNTHAQTINVWLPDLSHDHRDLQWMLFTSSLSHHSLPWPGQGGEGLQGMAGIGINSAQGGEAKLVRSQTAENTRENQDWKNGRGWREEAKDNCRQGVLSCLPEQR